MSTEQKTPVLPTRALVEFTREALKEANTALRARVKRLERELESARIREEDSDIRDFEVTFTVTGSMIVEAASEEEACEQAKRHYLSADQLGLSVAEIESVRVTAAEF